MKKHLVRVVVIAVALALPFAGAAEAKKKPPRKATKTAKVLVLTPDQIAAALIGVSDAPIGWSAMPPQTVGASATSGYCNGQNALARGQALGMTTNSDAGIVADPQLGPIIHEAFYEMPSVAAAKSFFDQTKAQVQSCPSWQDTTENGLQRTLTPSELSFPQGSAQQMYPLRLTVTTKNQYGNGPSSVDDIITVRVDNHVIVMTRVGTGADANQLNEYVGKALAKLGTAIQAAKTATTATKTAK